MPLSTRRADAAPGTAEDKAVCAGRRAAALAHACVVAPRACAVVALLVLLLWRCSACFLLVLVSLLRVLVAAGSYERGTAGSEVLYLLGARYWT